MAALSAVLLGLLAACDDAAPRVDASLDALRDAPDATELAPRTCVTACEALGARCDEALVERCRAACDGDAGAMDATASDGGSSALRACLAAAEDCLAARRCLGRGFHPGPYGIRPRDVAGGFTLETTAGPWRFEEHYTGEDSYVFLVYTSAPYSTQLFQSSFADLLAESPPGVHYFFLRSGATPGFDAFRQRAQDELAALADGDREHWSPRVHFVPGDVTTLPGWIGDLVRTRRRAMGMYPRYESVQFAIDRFQRIREVGQLGRLAQGGLRLELRFLANEPKYYDFEWERERTLASHPATVVQLLERRVVHERVRVEVRLPDAATMESFDTLEVDLSTDCQNHRDGDCGAWDYLSHLRLCTPAPPPPDGGVAPDAGPDGGVALVCRTELARWITTYWREGRWVTDISAMLALLRAGGTQTFEWYATGQFDPRRTEYVTSLALRFGRRGRGLRPVEARAVFTGGRLDAGYNARHEPVRFRVPEGTRRVELYTLVTGHGSETRQCAEFCNHTHHFRVNNREHAIEFPEAQTLDGCTRRVGEGVVPNQHGTWYFGRGGWCPGWDVRPVVHDVTGDLVPGENTLSYRALVGVSPPLGPATYGNVELVTYLVFWR